MGDLTFYLGTHILNHIEKTNVPLFVSIRRLNKRKRKPFTQKGLVSIDSGGFSELSLFGRWKTSPEEYVENLQRVIDLGIEPSWASQQDWMVEEVMLAKTGKTIQEHQSLTVANFETLRSLESPVHIIPVLQGQSVDDYMNHLDQFADAGFDLKREPTVGVGSVCRRQHTEEIGEVMSALAGTGLNLHGFGVKKAGLLKYGEHLSSADSMAWSFNARRDSKRPECASKAKNCANCLHYALEWREGVVL